MFVTNNSRPFYVMLNQFPAGSISLSNAPYLYATNVFLNEIKLHDLLWRIFAVYCNPFTETRRLMKCRKQTVRFLLSDYGASWQILIIKPNRRPNFSNLFWNKILHVRTVPLTSSGIFYCTHSNSICHTGLLKACEQDQNVPSWSCSQAVSKPIRQ